ncbi:uncharacterized protein [Chelonus insularis]|uniref:uncharacterized protein n=1 Tax=Chelonus insularis TaxID=460826 RepID=UPI00158D3238|nr:uncharacterized protein LOC118069288 [Chelonus insularis]
MKYSAIIVLLFVTNVVFSKHFKHHKHVDWDDDIRDKNDFRWLLDDDNDVVTPENKTQRVCKTNECEILAKEFLKGIDENVDPCNNFYDFICGSWQTNYKIPGYTMMWSRPLMFQHTVYRRIKGILEVEPKKSDILPVRQAKKWYRACMDTDTLEKRGIKPLESILMQLGGWPMTIDVEEWDENGHSWQRIEQHYFHLTGSHIFFDIKPSWAGSQVRIETMDLPLMNKLPLKYRNYTANEYDEYKKLVKNIVQMFIDHNRANVSETMLEKDLKDLIEFEKGLYMLDTSDDVEKHIDNENDDDNDDDSDDNDDDNDDNDDEDVGDDDVKDVDDVSNDDKSDDSYDTIEEFVERYDDKVNAQLGRNLAKINFRRLIQSKFDMINMPVNTSWYIMGRPLSFYAKVTDLINKTSKRTIVNYLHWHFVSDMLVYTTEKMRNEFHKYKKHEYGVMEREPRWLECTKEVKLELAQAYAFVKKYFSEEVERTARKMIDNIRDEMKEQISTSVWMNEETKAVTIDKLESMKVLLGYSESFKNKTIVKNYYKGLIIGYDHFDNVLSFRKYETKKHWEQVLKDTEEPKDIGYSVDSLVVNAFYSPDFNFIELPAADFQPPLFTSQLPSVVNYGLIGSVIGHEIGHAFDINGIHYGKDGNLTKISKQVMEIYYKRAECFLEQFNEYFGVTEPEYEDTTPYAFEGSRGRRTRGENMADTTGLHSVVKAYQKMRAKNPDVVVKLPGLEKYTDDQMFFISFGALWCQKTTPEFQKMSEMYDVHSPAPIRVIGAVSNTNDFSKAFKCPKGSPMNPENKCDIWKPKSNDGSEKVKKNYRYPWVLKCLLSVVNHQVFSKYVKKWEDDDSIKRLGWLFDMDEGPDVEDLVKGDESRVCTSKECRIVANEFKKSMNKSVDPCNNFYDHVCGSLTLDIIPPYQPNWNRLESFQEVIFRRLKEILEEKPLTNEILPVRQAKKWYQACLDIDTLNKRSLTPIESVLMQVGGWPIAIDPQEWDENQNSWQDIEQHYLEIIGSYVFFTFSPAAKKFQLEMQPGDLPLQNKLPSEYRDYDIDNYEAYATLVKGVALLFADYTKADVTEEMIEQDVQDLVEFEKKLYMISNLEGSIAMPFHKFVKEYRKNVTLAAMSSEESSQEDKDSDIQMINFHELLSTLFDSVDYILNNSMVLHVQNPEYYIKLTELLNETPKRTVINYMHWHFISKVLQYTTEDMRDAIFMLMDNVLGVKERSPRWLECITEMKLMPAAGYAFAQKYFSDDIDNAGHTMVKNIRKQMQKEIQASTWMDDETKKLVIEKLEKLKMELGFPSWFNNQTIIINSYKGLIIGSDHFDNMLSYEKYELKLWLRMRFGLDDFDYVGVATNFMDPTEVNAAYDPESNAIYLPAADFQPPLFTSKLPWSVNYGVAGVVIGHEIGHAFDDDGITYGENGESTHISKTMLDMYYKRAECFLDQFNEYYGVTEANCNGSKSEGMEQSKGRRTRGENIADTTGLDSVYDAYIRMIKTEMGGSDYKLPGFEEYSDSQMFFISFGTVWCERMTKKYQDLMYEYDEHSPGRWRVIGGVSNVKAFAEAFNCPLGSPMNPENKCNIWKSQESKAAKKQKMKASRKNRRHRRRHHPFKNWLYY